MWKAFRKSAARNAPGAAIFFDKFHVMPHLEDALDKFRKHEYARLSGKNRSFIPSGPGLDGKGQKYTLLSNRENLSLDGCEALKKPLSANRRLNTANVLKESFEPWWSYKSKA